MSSRIVFLNCFQSHSHLLGELARRLGDGYGMSKKPHRPCSASPQGTTPSILRLMHTPSPLASTPTLSSTSSSRKQHSIHFADSPCVPSPNSENWKGTTCLLLILILRLLACFSFSALLCLLVVKFADDQPALSDSPTHRSALFRGTSRSLQPCSVCIICPLRSAILH